MTHFQSVPESGDAIVVLTNSQRSWPFISYLLSEWASWRGLPSVGMERIIWGRYGLIVLVGILFSAAILMVRHTMINVCRKKIGLKGIEKTRIHYCRVQWIQFGISLALTGILLWCVCQRYLFLTSVFPMLSAWLGGAIMLFTVALFLSAIFSYNRKEI